MTDDQQEQHPQDMTEDERDGTSEEKDSGNQEQDGGKVSASGQHTDELEEAKEQVADLNSRLLRAHADFENYRRRMSREKEDLAAYANQKLLVNLLPVLDNLERALSAPKVEGDDKLRQGVELTARSFREILAKEGLTPIEAVGQSFDPNFHEAVMTVESDDHDDGTIVSEFQKGYTLGERVIRPSMVQVSKKG